MGLFRKKMPHTAGEVDKNRLPPPYRYYYGRGNGRWAKQRSLPRTAGHKAGAEVFGISPLTAKSWAWHI